MKQLIDGIIMAYYTDIITLKQAENQLKKITKIYIKDKIIAFRTIARAKFIMIFGVIPSELQLDKYIIVDKCSDLPF